MYLRYIKVITTSPECTELSPLSFDTFPVDRLHGEGERDTLLKIGTHL